MSHIKEAELRPLLRIDAEAVSPVFPHPSAPPMPHASPYHVCPVIAPADVISAAGPIPDRVVRESIVRSVVNGNIDGRSIVISEHRAAAASQSIGENISAEITTRVRNGNRLDRVDNLSVSAVSIVEAVAMDSQPSEGLFRPSGQQKMCEEKGYRIAEYRSQYDSSEYKMPEYKSMYD